MSTSQIDFIKPLSWGQAAYDNFASLQEELINFESENIHLTISSQEKLNRTFLFLIMCLYRLCEQCGKELSITVSKKIYQHLDKMSFIQNPQITITRGAELRFKHLGEKEDISIISKDIVKGMPVELSPRLYEDMVSKIGEMFNNAIEHSEAPHVFGGRYNKPGKKYCFACYDTGIGIVEKVRQFKKDKSLTDEAALSWALAPLNTTIENSSIPRGQGFSLLQNFTSTNRGIIRICTGRVLYTFDSKTGYKGHYKKLNHNFSGTLFEMDINTDEVPYQYEGESSNE